MTRASWVLLFVFMLLANGCALSAAKKPYGTPGSAVRPTSPGNYVYFNGEFESSASGQYIFNFDYDELNTLTDDERVGQYLLSRGLIPPDCHDGIHIIRGGRGENGMAWLIFQCQ